MTHEELDSPEQERGYSIADVTRLLREYRTVIRLSLLAIAVAFVIIAITSYVLLPAERTSTLNFRLTFRGADTGEYPNGTTFSVSEILSPVVLSRVFQQNGLERFVDYSSFKSSIFIVQRNDELDALTAEYRARLADPKLTPVDRARIEQEFIEKKQSLSKADHAIVMVANERLRQLPITTRTKILNDVLSTWAEQTVRDKGVLLYDISIVSGGVFGDVSSTPDYLMAADLIRLRLRLVSANIDELLQLPGAKVLRTKTSRRSLGEIRARLDDLAIYRVQPLIVGLARNGITRSETHTVEFLRSAISFSDMSLRSAQGRVSAVRESIKRYLEQRGETPTEDTATGTPSSVVDKGFLDRILQLSAEQNDLEFRQKLVEEYRTEALRVVPVQAEAQYYRELLDTFQARRPPTAEEAARIETDIRAVVTEARAATDEVNEIYSALSEDLNPSTALYVINEPVRHVLERPVNVSMLALVGILTLFAAFPAIVIGCFIHQRFFTGKDTVSDAEVTAADHTPAIEDATH